MNSLSMSKAAAGRQGNAQWDSARLPVHVFAYRDAWAAAGTVMLGALLALASQLLVLQPHANPTLMTTVDLVELPPEPVVMQAATPPPAPPVSRQVTKILPVPQIPVARAALPETAQTISVPDAPRELPKVAEASNQTPAPAKVIEAPIAKPAVEPAAAPRSNSAAEGAYQAGARERVEKQKRYPEEALQMNMSGVVTVVYSISREGRLIRVEVEKSSGHSLLDRAALDAVRRARFEPMPADAWIGSKEQTFRTRIEFSMN